MLLPIYLLFLKISFIFGYIQYINVTGQYVCNKIGLPNLRIDLMERDMLMNDDHLNYTTTNSQGYFTIYGEEDEFFGITPYLIVQHQCNKREHRNCSIKNVNWIDTDLVNKGLSNVDQIELFDDKNPICFIYGNSQILTLKGQYVCESQGIPNLRIDLMDHYSILNDSHMGNATTDEHGFFTISGSDNDFLNINPYLVVEHQCNKRKNRNCRIKKVDWIDGKHIGVGVADVGQIELFSVKNPSICWY
uniref:Transthyretin-like family-containing protein n=1 Tax=Rhabditophanes sp. KR3021 TaxID=114890 RepID=A0AC35TG91_9BILA